MKKILLLLPVIVSVFCHGQDNEARDSPGQVNVKIYTHFNTSLGGMVPGTAFEVKRAYFGYQRSFGTYFSSEIKLDIGSPDDVSEFSLIRRYTYFKNAYVSFEKGKIKSWFGLFDMLQYKVQEQFWGYRYLYKSYMDEYRFGPSADLGTAIMYSPFRHLQADFTISNGEGYTSLQFDNIYKFGGGITLTPFEGFTFRAYYASYLTGNPQWSITGFAGYKAAKWRAGGEYIHQMNYRFNQGLNRYGYSVYSTYVISGQWEVFVRYDQLYSNILPESSVPWNLVDDGSAMIGGLQYAPVDQVKISLNYQDWVEYAQNGESEPFLYLNFEIVF
jgi:hypothetical protein